MIVSKIFDKEELKNILDNYFRKGQREAFELYENILKREEVLNFIDKINKNIFDSVEFNELISYIESIENKDLFVEDLKDMRNTLNNYMKSGLDYSLLDYENFKNKISLYFKIAFLFSLNIGLTSEMWASPQTLSLLENFLYMHLCEDLENHDIEEIGFLYLKSLSWNPVVNPKEKASFILQDVFLSVWDKQWRNMNHEPSLRFKRLTYFFECALLLWDKNKEENQKILSELYARMGDLKLLSSQYLANPRGISEATSYYENAYELDSQNTYALEKKKYTQDLLYTFLTNARMQHDMRSRIGSIHILLSKLKENTQDLENIKGDFLNLESHLQRMFAIFDINEKSSSEKVVKGNLYPYLEKIKDMKYDLHFNIKSSLNAEVYFIPKFLDVIVENVIKNTITAYENMKKPVHERIFDLVFEEEKGRLIFHDRAGGIPQHLLEKDKLFLPFTSTKKDVSMNVGLGLGLCRQAAELMQAKFLSPQLDEDGKGTNFILEFYVPNY